MNSRVFLCVFTPLQTGLCLQRTETSSSPMRFTSFSLLQTFLSSHSHAASHFYFNLEGKGWLPTGVPATIKTRNWAACVPECYFSELKVSLTKLKSAAMFLSALPLAGWDFGLSLPFSGLVVATTLTTSIQLHHPRPVHPPLAERANPSKSRWFTSVS